jgi:hypothetical protein
MVNKDPVMRVYLEHKTATVFAPTNDAIAKLEAKNLRQEIRDKIASYHVGKSHFDQHYFINKSFYSSARIIIILVQECF